jgi:succinoglycan biosynthesis transport protein ExoP
MDRDTLVSISFAVRRRWWLALLVLVMVLATDVLVTAHSPRTYLARASLLIGPSASVDRGQLVYSIDALGRSMVVGTYADVLATDLVRREALAQVGISPDVPDAEIEIKTAALADSTLVQVTAVAPDPVLAAAVANAVGQVGEVQMSQLYPIYDLTVVTAATPPTSMYRPDVLRNLSLGLLLGLLLATASAWMYDVLVRPASRRTV